ncbi:hypothetical protein RA280_11655 [Cupriavidus sp. CV2]|nr:hypothetical protein [Cupriavidus sp. CV2]MDW3682392.1 hypothetical protein [Cupriavidus sp. CV2]
MTTFTKHTAKMLASWLVQAALREAMHAAWPHGLELACQLVKQWVN